MSPLCQLQMTLPGGFPGVLGVTVRLMSDGVRYSLRLRKVEPARSKFTLSPIADFGGRLAVGRRSTIQ
jgi:hypothetical protein